MKSLQHFSNESLKHSVGIILIPTISLLILFSALILVTSGCDVGPYAPGSRGECENCDNDIDCKEGMTCELFSSKTFGALVSKCATSRTKKCP